MPPVMHTYQLSLTIQASKYRSSLEYYHLRSTSRTTFFAILPAATESSQRCGEGGRGGDNPILCRSTKQGSGGVIFGKLLKSVDGIWHILAEFDDCKIRLKSTIFFIKC